MTDWTPTETDIRFMRQLMELLQVGEIWGYRTRPMRFVKQDERTLACVMCADTGDCAEQLRRVRISTEAAGFVFEDDRGRERQMEPGGLIWGRN